MPKWVKALRYIALWLTIFVVCTSPWFAASNEIWGYYFLGLIVLFAAWLAFLCLAFDPVCEKQDIVIMFFVMAWLLLFLLQLLPVTPQLLCYMNNFSAVIWQDANHLLSNIDINDILPEIKTRNYGLSCISLSPLSTWHSLILFINYAFAFLTVLMCLRSWKQISVIITTLTISSCFILLITIVTKYDICSYLWNYARLIGGSTLGPFSNKNHFALFLNIMFTIAAGITWISAAMISRKHPEQNYGIGLSYAIDFASEVPLRLFVSALLAAGVFFSLSRGGVLSLIVAIAVFAVLFIKRGGMRRDGRGRNLMFWTAVVAFVLVLLLGWEKIFSRLFRFVITGERSDDLGRLKVLPYMMTFIHKVWITGCGFGSFRHVFPVFQGEEIQFGRWLHSHNEWLQLFAEGGIFSFILLGISVILILREINEIIRAKETRINLFGIAIAGTATVVIVHSLFDYGLNKPPNAWTVAILIAVCFVIIRFRHDYNVYANLFQKTFFIRILAVIILVVIMLAIYWEYNLMTTFCRLSHIRLYHREMMKSGSKAMDREYYLRKILYIADRLNTSYCLPDSTRETSYKLISFAMDKDLDPDLRLETAKQALRFAYNSVVSAPSDYLAWLQLARSLAVVGEWRDALLCLDMAKKMAPPGSKNSLFY